MFALLKKQVLVNVTLKEPSELTAIAKLASFAGEKLDLASQELRSGFLASEAQGARVIADHIAVTHASSSDLRRESVVIITLAEPLAWGENAQIDTLVGLVVPSEANTEDALARVVANTQAQAAALQPQASASAIEKCRRQLL